VRMRRPRAAASRRWRFRNAARFFLPRECVPELVRAAELALIAPTRDCDASSARRRRTRETRIERAIAPRVGRGGATGAGPDQRTRPARPVAPLHGAVLQSAPVGLASASKIYACCWAMGPMTGKTVVFPWKVVTNR